MRETKFIEQNKEKWAEFEQMVQQGKGAPEKLNDLFVQVTDDLSYARTFYPNRSVKVYLNHLAQRAFHLVYKGRRFQWGRVTRFWTEGLPQVIWESRRTLTLALALFVLSFGIGVLSSVIDPGFARVVLGDNYIQMTIDNIENGDPMAVYKDHQPLGSAAGIAANNLFVAFQTAIFGVLASIGTAFMLMYNGIMVGAFQYFFIDRGLFWQSFLAIWIHGTLEISAIILAGGAGLTAGSGLLFPGTYTRTQAFQISMRRGMRIFVGIVPVIVLAAIFEGFLTRFTDIGDVARGIFILANLAFVVGYFVVFPWMKARRGDFEVATKDSDLPPQKVQPVSFTQIKGVGEIISDTFALVKQNLQWTLGSVAAAALAHTLAMRFWDAPTEQDLTAELLLNRAYSPVSDLSNYFGTDFSDPVCWIAILLLSGMAFVGHRILASDMPELMRMPWSATRVLSLVSMLLPLLGIGWYMQQRFAIITITALWIMFPLTTLPFVIATYWIGALRFGSANPFSGLVGALQSLRWNTTYLIGTLLLGFMVMLLLFLDSNLWTMFLQFFSWAVPPGEDHVATFARVVTTFFSAFILHFTWLLLSIAGALHFFSQREITQAPHLMHQIEGVGTIKQIRGLPKE